MIIEINPHSLSNLLNICEVLHKLHPLVLDYLVDMQRSIGDVMGLKKLDEIDIKQREILCYLIENSTIIEPTSTPKSTLPDDRDFYDLKRYLKLDTYEYIPIKISIEVEDFIGRKLRELVRALEKTSAPEQFLYNKREIDEYAYFAEGYGLTMNEEQKKKFNDFLDSKDYLSLLKLLIEEKLYP